MDFFKKVITTVSAVGGSGLDPNFPYVLDEEVMRESQMNGIWKVHQGHRKDASGHVTVFVADLVKNKAASNAARNMLKRLKTLRHPKILRLIEGVEVDGKIYIASESVVPFHQFQADISKNPDWLLWILHDLSEGLKFINESARTFHGNIRKNSIFFTSSGEVRIAGFELASSVTEDHALLMDQGRYMTGIDLNEWPPELRSLNWQKIRGNPIHSIDTWMLAQFIMNLSKSLPPAVLSFCREAVNPDPSRRHSFVALLEPSLSRRIFSCPLIACDQMIERLQSADAMEKDRIFLGMQKYATSFPRRYINFKLLPSVITLLQIHQDGIEGIKLVLSICSDIDQTIFDTGLVPFIKALFSRPDRAVRLVLLDFIEMLAERLAPQTIQDCIFGQLCAGFSDPMPELRERTLKASIVLIPKLTSRQISIDLVRHFGKLQTDEQPGIRVNALVCLGKISDKLDAALKKKVFIASIGRALQDPFPPARLSGLIALMTMVDCLPADVLARHMLPSMCPLLIDNDSNVKSKAFQVVRIVTDHLETDVSKEPTEDGKETKTSAGWGLGSITSSFRKEAPPAPRPVQPIVPPIPEVQESKPMQLQKKRSDGWDEEELLDLEISDEPIESVLPLSTSSSSPIAGIVLESGWGDSAELDPWANS